MKLELFLLFPLDLLEVSLLVCQVGQQVLRPLLPLLVLPPPLLEPLRRQERDVLPDLLAGPLPLLLDLVPQLLFLQQGPVPGPLLLPGHEILLHLKYK